MTAGCKKYLSETPNPTLAIPNSVADLQSLLDNYSNMNFKFPTTTVMLSDDYYLLPADLNSVTNAAYRNQYMWQPDNSLFSDWVQIYIGPINTANVVLDNLQNVPNNNANKNDLIAIQASALFYRAFYFLAGAQLFAQPYQKASANTDLGMALRLDGDFNKVSVRSSVAETYDQIIRDLLNAAANLPDKQLLKTRPTKSAAYGALARTYLSMNDLTNAGKYADLCINTYGPDSLLDFNTLSTTVAAPFKQFNREVIFHAIGQTNTLIANSRAKIDSNLYLSYNNSDLRKKLYFKSNNNNTYQFKGDYNGSGTSSGYAFGGIVLDEMYLIRAEAYARNNQIPLAMGDLNKLLKSRWTNSSFVPVTAGDIQTALTLILTERRKELIFRGTRWTDLRRLKDDPIFSVTPQRKLGTQMYTLAPNNPRYTLLIPASAINISGMQQNP
jgi:hypothetical protein